MRYLKMKKKRLKEHWQGLFTVEKWFKSDGFVLIGFDEIKGDRFAVQYDKRKIKQLKCFDNDTARRFIADMRKAKMRV